VKTINENIANNQYKNIYLLMGTEKYLKKQCKDKLKKALVQEGFEMNYNYYEGDGINPSDVIANIATMPFFADYRLVVIENSGFFKKGCEMLEEYIKNPVSTTIIVFVEEEVDKRSKLYKALLDNAYIASLDMPSTNDLKRWVLAGVSAAGLKIRDSACEYFLENSATSMENISKELEKLICYTLDKGEINIDDVKAVCIQKLEDRIFDMMTFMAKKEQKRALELYADLLLLKEAPIRILFMMARQYNQMLLCKDLLKEGKGNKEIALLLSVRDFVVPRLAGIVKNYTREEIKKCVELCVDTENAIKTGNVNDQIGVEMAIVELSK